MFREFFEVFDKGRAFRRLLAFAAACGVTCTVEAAEERPNIVIIMADDLGYSDFGCYGGEIDTPNVDALASAGLRYRQFYNSSRCCPTRASLMTGRYPHEVNLHLNGNSFSADAPTIAEALKEQGYATAMVGKWHLSQTPARSKDGFFAPQHLAWVNNQEGERWFADEATYPINRGFDHYYGVIWGVINFFDPFALVEGDQPVTEVEDGYYFTEAVTEKTVEYIDQLSKEDAPFFLYVAHAAPHWPLHAPEDRIQKYDGVYDEGWDALRAERFSRQLELGLVDEASYQLGEVERGPLQAWEELDEKQRALYIAKMQTHAAMVDMLDESIGQIVSSLEANGELENTLLLVLSDNGASPEEVIKPGYDRPSETRDGRTMLYSGQLSAEQIGTEICWTGIGPAWANAANTPFRFWKKESYEGGNNTPMIVHWPAGIDDRGGQILDTVAHVIDVFPTALELAGAEAPEARGESLLASWQNESYEDDKRPLFFEHEGGAAARVGKWKIARLMPHQAWRLYDMEKDRTESNDLAAEFPEVVRVLDAKWNDWYQSVLPEEGTES